MTQNERPDKRIKAAIDNLSPKQKRLARFVIKNKYFMSFASASQVGEKTNTSAATVVRFAQTLGYEGFSELQADIRSELPNYLKAVEDIQDRPNAGLAPENITKQAFYQDIANIERTANNLQSAKLDLALEEIIKAEKIIVLGSGLSSASAVYLAHSLKVIGLDAREIISGGLKLAVEVAQFRSGMLLIAVDMWRYSRSSVETIATANKYGACTIAITDSDVSPLAQIADYAFEVSTDGIVHSFSAAAMISLFNVIIARLSYRIPDQVMQALQRVDSAYREGNLLTAE